MPELAWKTEPAANKKITMVNNLSTSNVRIFVFGTLRAGGRLDYYMEGTSPLGLYYTRGQLMQSEIGSAYIDFKQRDIATIGEVYHVNFACLKRINHLESTSGEFPKGYDLDMIPVWQYTEGEKKDFNEDKKIMAFFYKRRNEPRPIKSGDWINRVNPIEEIGRYLMEETNHTIYPEDVIAHMTQYMLDY